MVQRGYFSYVRVSTQRQGITNTSLGEQRSAIKRYADRFSLPIKREFEERETAAKQGRPIFLEMLKELRLGKATGIIVHKIDRSARNLRDWADLGSLIDTGIEVHFANENIDLTSRGGRLSADIQAVVASDYIRNLREETKKGIYGRLKQGLYPFPAPLGYINNGKGKPKTIDPVKAPLVRRSFELYASGDISLDSLVGKIYEFGLRNKNGNKISRNGLVCFLKNPFYVGVVRVSSTNEIFAGVHEPMIPKKLFAEVQDVFAGKRIRKETKHFFIFRRIINCNSCNRLLIAEKQKGYIYYRCHTKTCPQKTLREDLIEEKLLDVYKQMEISEKEYKLFLNEADKYKESEPKRLELSKKQILMEQSQIETRLAKLADAYVDEVFDKDTYFLKKNELVIRKQATNQKLDTLAEKSRIDLEDFQEFLELLKSASLSYKTGNAEHKREMVKLTTSNFFISGKSLIIKLEKPFQIAAERPRVSGGSSKLATTRTFEKIYSEFKSYYNQ